MIVFLRAFTDRYFLPGSSTGFSESISYSVSGIKVKRATGKLWLYCLHGEVLGCSHLEFFEREHRCGSGDFVYLWPFYKRAKRRPWPLSFKRPSCSPGVLMLLWMLKWDSDDLTEVFGTVVKSVFRGRGCIKSFLVFFFFVCNVTVPSDGT